MDDKHRFVLILRPREDFVTLTDLKILKTFRDLSTSAGSCFTRWGRARD